MKLKILSEKFYNTYADCKEILKKEDRPFLRAPAIETTIYKYRW